MAAKPKRIRTFIKSNGEVIEGTIEEAMGYNVAGTRRPDTFSTATKATGEEINNS